MDRYEVIGVEPTNVAHIAVERGIPTVKQFFSRDMVKQIATEPAKLITACNVFAHIPDPHDVIEGILDLLAPDGVFISENHYLFGLLDRCQYDTIYHEHLRYYSIASLHNLFKPHGLYINKVEAIPTHGGSIRVYASRDQGRGIDVTHYRDKYSMIEPTGEV